MRSLMGTRSAVAVLVLTALVLACSGLAEVPTGMAKATFAVA